MSKKNKRKFASQAGPAPAAAAENTAAAKEAETEKPAKLQENEGYNVNKELRNLAIIAFVLIALLVGLYYYDQQTHILQQFTSKFFAIF